MKSLYLNKYSLQSSKSLEVVLAWVQLHRRRFLRKVLLMQGRYSLLKTDGAMQKVGGETLKLTQILAFFA